MTTPVEKVVWSVVRMCFRAIFFVADWILKFTYWGEAQEVPPVRNSILMKSATKLAAEIREGKLRSQDVVLAYMERILKVEPYINATVERRFEEAMKEAAQVDALVASGVMNREKMAREKPLLGVPLSVKVLLTVKGMRSTASSMLFLDTKAAEDAPSVAALREAGAIVIATTTTPEMGLGFESNSYAHGKTCNPYDITRTSGGSSGGESALIAAAGSVIGLGNDMMGSVRVPSHFTGIFAHKPTRGYVSMKGCFPVPDAPLERFIYTGPMCRYAEDLNVTMATLTAHNGTPLKFGQKVNFKNLKLYYMLKSKGPLMVDVDPEITGAIKKVGESRKKLHVSMVYSLAFRIFLKALEYFYRTLRHTVHSCLAIVYRNEAGRTVPPVRDPILLKSATQLAEEIRTRKLKSQDVVLAYLRRMAEVEPHINATVERRSAAAVREAKEVDAFVTSGAMTREQMERERPLLGVPLTVKVLLTVKGMRSTAGSLLFRNARAAEDAPTVALMRRAGAIVLATTNTAEMGMHFETSNYAHGRTSNPYDLARTSGGSSGGESALISAGGSVLGLGNDMAGSIRLPCMFTGLFGHKPSRGLVSSLGSFPAPIPELDKFLFTGPMCRYSMDLQLAMSALTSQHKNPPKFGQPVNFKELKVYYMTSVGYHPLITPIDSETSSAIKKAVFHFESTYGIKATEVKMPMLKSAAAIYIHSLMSTCKDIGYALTSGKGDITPAKELFRHLLGRSTLTQGPIIVMNSPYYPALYNEDDVEYYRKLGKKLAEKFRQLLDDNSVLLFPTFPVQAPYHHEITLLLPSTCYTLVYNLLGLPVTQCPMGLRADGLPVGLQIVGAMNNDPLTIACAAELEKAFGGWTPPGRTTE